MTSGWQQVIEVFVQVGRLPNAAAFVCDGCRQQVMGDGCVTWSTRRAEPGRPERLLVSPVFVAHFECQANVNDLLTAQFSETADWRITGVMEISQFLDSLGKSVREPVSRKGRLDQSVAVGPDAPLR